MKVLVELLGMLASHNLPTVWWTETRRIIKKQGSRFGSGNKLPVVKILLTLVFLYALRLNFVLLRLIFYFSTPKSLLMDCKFIK